MSFLVSLIHTGDSISNGIGSYPYQAYGWTSVGDETQPQSCAQATYYSGSDLIARMMGIAGTHLDTGGPYDLVNLCPTWIDPMGPVGYVVPPFNRARRFIFSTAIGSNDGAIDGYSTVDEYAAAVAACCNLRRAAGFDRIGITTLLPRGDAELTEPHRAAYNAMVKSSLWRMSHNIDFVIDFTAQEIMNDPASCNNALYYEQIAKVHPTVLGGSLLAPLARAAWDAAIATL